MDSEYLKLYIYNIEKKRKGISSDHDKSDWPKIFLQSSFTKFFFSHESNFAPSNNMGIPTHISSFAYVHKIWILGHK